MIITPVAGYLSPLHSVVAGEGHVVRLTLRDAHDEAIVSVDGQGPNAKLTIDFPKVGLKRVIARFVQPS